MAEKIPTKNSIKMATIKDMKKLGVHKPEYNRLIDLYAGLVYQYYQISDEFEKGGYQYETSTADGGSKKSAIVATLENLRKDILTYSDRLCLNPQAATKDKSEKPKKISKLGEALKNLDKG